MPVRYTSAFGRAVSHHRCVAQREHNFAGVTVHLAARVQAKATPGQSLVTSTVREAMLGAAVSMTSQDTFELKGIPDRWELFAAEV
jgi:class 3 adenylate cyclase